MTKLDKTATRVQLVFAYGLSFSFALLIAVYMGLTPLGYWADEYFLFAVWRQGGTSYYDRILHWSPRPVAEGLSYLYMVVVQLVGRPLIAPVLVLLWLVVVAATVRNFRERGCTSGLLRGASRLLVATTVLVLFLVGHPVGNMFYWPLGALAYLPTIAAITYVLFLTLDTGIHTYRQAVLRMIALLLAAMCSEVGAMFVGLYAGFLTFKAFHEKFLMPGLRQGSSTEHRMSPPSSYWGLPLLVSVATVLLMASNRATRLQEIMQPSSCVHHLDASLIAGTPQFIWDFASRDGQEHTTSGLLSGILIKGLFLAGVWILGGPSGHPRQERLVQRYLLLGFAFSSIAAAFLSVVAADYQFGKLCCERHETLRQCLYILALTSIALVIPKPNFMLARSTSDVTRLLAPLALLGAVATPLTSDIPRIYSDYAAFNTIRTARVATWRSGIQTGKPGMQFYQYVPGQIVGGVTVAASTYTVADNPPWYIKGIAIYFHKRSVTMLTPISLR